MDATTFTNLVTSIDTQLPFVNEAAATAALCRKVVDLGAVEIWTAAATSIPGVVSKGSWTATKTYDAAWAFTPGTQPTHALQLKHPNTGKEAQQIVLFVADAAFSAIDHIEHPGITHSILAYYDRSSSTHWQHLSQPASSKFLVTLNPSSAAMGNATRDWIDPKNGRIKPTKRTTYNRIFGSGTNGKFVGLWRRPGTFEFTVNVQSWQGRTHAFVCFTVTSPTFTGPGDVRDWWP